MSDKKDEAVQMVLKNVRVKYAKVIKPGKAYDDSKPEEWSVNMYVTDEDTAALVAAGVACKEDKDGHEYYLAKRATKNSKGDAIKPPMVVDSKKAPFTDDIGNGSVCNIAVTLFPWERDKGKRKGILLYLNAVQVVNHVAYNAGGTDVFDVVDGNTGDDADRF
jgi:hypothetical protein